jgi:integrase
MTTPKRRKQRVTMHKGFNIRHRPDGKYQVDIRQQNIRVRKIYDTLGEAKGKCDEVAFDLQQGGNQAFALREEEKQDALRALEILGSEVHLTEAAKFWRQHHPVGKEPVRFDELVRLHLEDAKHRQLRETSIQEISVTGKRFTKDLGSVMLNDLTRERIEQWLASKKKWSAANYNKHLRYLKCTLNFAVKKKLLALNPADGISTIKREKQIPTILPPETITQLLHTAEQMHPNIVPYLAIGFFAGLRPNELSLLTWDRIDRKGGLIHVLPEVSKTRRSRFVDISENLDAWLEKYWGLDGDPISPTYMTFRRCRVEVGTACGLSKWPPDVMRHCFATYYLATHTIDETCKQLGHASTAMLYDHYRGLARAQDEEKFWNVCPSTGK